MIEFCFCQSTPDKADLMLLTAKLLGKKLSNFKDAIVKDGNIWYSADTKAFFKSSYSIDEANKNGYLELTEESMLKLILTNQIPEPEQFLYSELAVGDKFYFSNNKDVIYMKMRVTGNCHEEICKVMASNDREYECGGYVVLNVGCPMLKYKECVKVTY